jgi:DNA-binding MarR family transcriptional regulator
MQSQRDAETLQAYFSGCLYFTAGRLFRTIDRLAANAFRRLDLAPSHAFLIMALQESPKRSATPSHLAQVMNLDRSTVTRLISALERKKLIGRSRSGRTTTISLQEKGSALLPEIRACWKDLYRGYCVIYGEQEANRVNDLIARINRQR